MNERGVASSLYVNISTKLNSILSAVRTHHDGRMKRYDNVKETPK